MKTTFVTQALWAHFSAGFPRFFSILLITGLAVATSCKDNDDSEPSLESACRVATETTTVRISIGNPDEYTYKAVYTHEYDNKGNPIETTSQYNSTYIDGKKASNASTSSQQYDANGFLLRSVRQYTGTDRDGVTSNSSGNEEFTYENGRLIKDAYTSTTDGKTTSYSFQYEYDDAGRIVKYSNTYNNSSTTFTYSGNIVQKITTTDGAGNVTSPFVQYNDKGLLTKSITTWSGGTDESRYEYTAEGQVAREERWINSKPSSGAIYEFDTRENPNRYAYPRPKGQPVVPGTQATFPQLHNITRVTYLEPNAEETAFQNRASTLYVYDYNAKGFPTGYTMTTTNAKGVVENSSTVTQEYANCN
jgi:hypothetical protein